MPRARPISPEFWTSEAVVDCPPMTRLLLLGLSTFADDSGALPLRPRTLRMQVFPGDALDNDQMRAMIEAMVARGPGAPLHGRGRGVPVDRRLGSPPARRRAGAGGAPRVTISHVTCCRR